MTIGSLNSSRGKISGDYALPLDELPDKEPSRVLHEQKVSAPVPVACALEADVVPAADAGPEAWTEVPGGTPAEVVPAGS